MTGSNFISDLRSNVRAELPFHLFVLLYGCAAMILALCLGRPEKMLALMYARRFIELTLLALCFFVAWQGLASIRASSPLQAFRRRLAAYFTPIFASRLLLFANISVFYGLFTSFKRMLSDLRDFNYDPQLAEFDQLLHGSDPWLMFSYSEPLTRAFQFFYLHGWLVCMVFFSLYVIVAQPPHLMRRFVTTFYLTWALLGNVVAAIFMSAGPVYYQAVADSSRFEPLLDRFEFSYGMLSSSVNVQDRLWQDYMLDLGLLGSGISAFPSLHVAMATLWTITAWSINKVLFACMATVLILVQLGSVYLGWHYAIDGYFSLVAVILLWALVPHLSNLPAKITRAYAWVINRTNRKRVAPVHVFPVEH